MSGSLTMDVLSVLRDAQVVGDEEATRRLTDEIAPDFDLVKLCRWSPPPRLQASVARVHLIYRQHCQGVQRRPPTWPDSLQDVQQRLRSSRETTSLFDRVGFFESGIAGLLRRHRPLERPLEMARLVLPMASSVPVLPGATVQVTARPGRPFRPRQLMITNAQDWVIQDILIGNTSQLAVAGGIPGEVFAPHAIDSGLSCSTCQATMDIAIQATYVGHNPEGERLACSFVGTIVQ